MKVLWKHVTLGALLLLGSAAAMEKTRSGRIGSGGGGVSHFDCEDVDNVGTEHLLMNHQASLMDGIKYFFGLDKKGEAGDDDDRIELKTNGVDDESISLPRRLYNIFTHYYSPSGRNTPTPSTEQVPSVGGGMVYKRDWPLPTDESTRLPIPKPFEARLLVGFVGDPYNLMDQEKLELADAFIRSYNDLDDRQDVTITNVTFIDDLNGVGSSTSQRRLQDSFKDLVDYAINFTELLGITGECGDVCDDPRLFAKPDGVQNRRLAIPSMAPHHDLRDESFRRKIQEESCVGCPTIEEFVTSYKSEIANLQADGRLVNVVDLDGTIVEQEIVECPSDDLTEFEAVFYVTFDTNAEPSDEEVKALELSFVESYNQANALNGETCDLSFRVVDKATVSKVTSDLVNVRNRKLENSKVTSNGRCRGCKERGQSTGDGISGRRALQSGIPVPKERPEWILDDTGLSDRNRGLQNTAIDANQCYCPIGEPEDRLPSIEELRDFYNENIQFLVEEGNLTSVSSVVDIVEEDNDDAECCDFPAGFDAAENQYGLFGGIVYQNTTNRSYNVTIDYSPAGIITTYPELSCGNTVPIEPSLVVEGRIEWTERIEFGNRGCIDDGRVTLVQNGDEWDYLWVKGSTRDEGSISFECNTECP